MDEQIRKMIKQMINSSKIFLFMKGTPEQPQCGFSAQVVDILNEQGIEFGSFNVYSDESIRQGIKEFSNWPTLPQLFVSGKFIGGCDIAVELAQSGELKKLVSK